MFKLFNFSKKSNLTTNSNEAISDSVISETIISDKENGSFMVKLPKQGPSFIIENKGNLTYFKPLQINSSEFVFGGTTYIYPNVSPVYFDELVSKIFTSVTLQVIGNTTIREECIYKYINANLDYSQIPDSLFDDFTNLVSSGINFDYSNMKVLQGKVSKYFNQIIRDFAKNTTIRSNVENLLRVARSNDYSTNTYWKFQGIIKDFVMNYIIKSNLESSYNTKEYFKQDVNALCWFATAFCNAFPLLEDYEISNYEAC